MHDLCRHNIITTHKLYKLAYAVNDYIIESNYFMLYYFCCIRARVCSDEGIIYEFLHSRVLMAEDAFVSNLAYFFQFIIILFLMLSK